MRFLVLILFTLILSKEANKHFSPSPVSSIEKCSLERSLILGEKRCIKPKLKKKLKELSLLHLFTPSGLHLSSILVFGLIHPNLRIFIILIAILYSFLFTHLYALQRVSLFYGINIFVRNTKASFFITFFLCLLFLQYSASPMSFLFSFIFWYTIIYHKSSKFRLVTSLFLIQALIAIILNQKLNLLSLIINPFLTLIVSSLFPILFLIFIFNILEPLRVFFYQSLNNFIELVYYDNLSINITIITLLFFYSFFTYYKKMIWLLFIISSNSTQTDKPIYTNVKSIIFPIASIDEVIKRKKDKIYFVDRRCRQKNFTTSCKIYPDHKIRVD